MSIVVRAAEPGDATRLGTVHVTAWQVGYRGMMPDHFLDALDIDDRATRWRTSLNRRSDSDTEQTLVAELDGMVVAMATVGPVRVPTEGVTGELWMLNADPAAWGTGAATALHIDACVTLHRLGHTDVVLWVLSENSRARRFYEREGWTADGASKSESFGDRAVTELRYRRHLA